MTSKKLTFKQKYVVSIAPGEEIINQLTQFVRSKEIKSGYIIGIGAVKSARLGHYSVGTKKYTERKIKKPMEVTNLTGIITQDKIHVHATFGTQMFKSYAGHLVKAVVSAACEVVVIQTQESVARKHSDKIGLDLLDL